MNSLKTIKEKPKKISGKIAEHSWSKIKLIRFSLCIANHVEKASFSTIKLNCIGKVPKLKEIMLKWIGFVFECGATAPILNIWYAHQWSRSFFRRLKAGRLVWLATTGSTPLWGNTSIFLTTVIFCHIFNDCKGVSDLETCMDYIELPGRSCKNLNFPTNLFGQENKNKNSNSK